LKVRNNNCLCLAVHAARVGVGDVQNYLEGPWRVVGNTRRRKLIWGLAIAEIPGLGKISTLGRGIRKRERERNRTPEAIGRETNIRQRIHGNICGLDFRICHTIGVGSNKCYGEGSGCAKGMRGIGACSRIAVAEIPLIRAQRWATISRRCICETDVLPYANYKWVGREIGNRALSIKSGSKPT